MSQESTEQYRKLETLANNVEGCGNFELWFESVRGRFIGVVDFEGGPNLGAVFAWDSSDQEWWPTGAGVYETLEDILIVRRQLERIVACL